MNDVKKPGNDAMSHIERQIAIWNTQKEFVTVTGLTLLELEAVFDNIYLGYWHMEKKTPPEESRMFTCQRVYTSYMEIGDPKVKPVLTKEIITKFSLWSKYLENKTDPRSIAMKATATKEEVLLWDRLLKQEGANA